MLIKVTNRCSRGCSHCMEDSVPRAPHMDVATFDAALKFTLDIEGLAHQAGYDLVLLSGGECTEHPEIVQLIRMVYSAGLRPLLISNGMWLKDVALSEAILSSFPDLMVQITYDPRFYPGEPPPRINDPRLVYIDSLTLTIPLGRFAGKHHAELPTRRSPTSFNFRSAVRAFGDARKALLYLRTRTAAGMSGHCAPSITHEGAFVAGETRLCYKLGSVYLPVEMITRAALEMRDCNRCGLESGLDPEQRSAIGLSPVSKQPQ